MRDPRDGRIRTRASHGRTYGWAMITVPKGSRAKAIGDAIVALVGHLGFPLVLSDVITIGGRRLAAGTPAHAVAKWFHQMSPHARMKKDKGVIPFVRQAYDGEAKRA